MAKDHQIDSLIRKHFRYNAGAFYGSAQELSVGVGLIYQGVRVPEFDCDQRVFATYERPVYVLTHECDVDQNNDRHFNESVIVCPVTPIGALADSFAQFGSASHFFGLLPDIAADKVFRVFLLPPGMPEPLTQGAILELNALCSTHISEFRQDRVTPLCALSEYAQGILDRKLLNHLLRPKADSLPRLN